MSSVFGTVKRVIIRVLWGKMKGTAMPPTVNEGEEKMELKQRREGTRERQGKGEKYEEKNNMVLKQKTQKRNKNIRERKI